MAKTKGRRKKIKVGRIIGLVFFVFVILGCVATGLVAGYVYNVVQSHGDYDLSILAGDLTTYVYDKNSTLVSEFRGSKDREILDPTEIPLTMKRAIISIEDQRFFKHKGVDPIRVAGAAVANLKSGSKSQGASTITMQVVRTCILEVGNTEKKWDRKIMEAWLALKMEKVYSKEQILAFYLNNVYYGQGAYSLATAAENYFNKSVDDLTLGECAFLAGVINGPGVFNPYKNMDKAKDRQAIVLNEMVKMGYITAEEAKAAKAEPLTLYYGDNEDGSDYRNQSFLDYVFEEASEILGIDGSNEMKMYTGGYRIYTTLDQVTQAKAEEVFNNPDNFPKASDEKKVQGAMVILDVHEGEIVSMVGGRDIQEVRGFNRATDALRQPGSSFKPIAVYGPALELGWNPGDVLDDFPDGFTTTDKKFVNSGRTYRGLTTLRVAVQNSLNTIAVKLIERIGVQAGVDFAKNLGITSLVETGPVLDAGPSLALGGLTKGVSPLQMTGAIAAFANEGVYNKPHAIRRIEDSNGNVLYEHASEKHLAMTPQTAYLMTDMLMSAVQSGTGTKARLDGRQVAGKTGTTTLNVDAWFVGYTTDLAAAVWMGYDQPDNMHNAYGGSYCAPIWKQVMEVAHRDLPSTNFKQPDGIVSVTIDAKSGMLPSELTPKEYIINEKFNANHVPTEESNVWVQAPVCAESGLLLTDNCPTTELKTFLRRQVPWVGDVAPSDSVLEIPTEYCSIHGGGGSYIPPDSDDMQLRLYSSVNNDDSGTTVSLSWYASKSDANTTFHVYRSTSPSTPANLATHVASLGSTTASYADKLPVGANETYYYYLQAIDKLSGQTLATSAEVKVTLGSGGTNNIQLQGAVITYGTGHAVQLVWNDIYPDDEIVYQVYRSESPDFSADASTMIASQLYTSSYTDATTAPGHVYYYRVTGIDLTTGQNLSQSTRLTATIPQ